MTAAPLVVDGQVVIGIAGGEYGARGFVVALDAKTGDADAGRRTPIPSPTEPGGDTWPKGMYMTGGGGTWLTGSYDPETKTLLWGVGNPGPWLADVRPGNNLYTDSVIALNPADGQAQVALPVHPARHVGLRRGERKRAGRHHLRGQAVQGAAARRPQRQPVRARPHERQVHLGQAVRQGDVGDRLRRRRHAADQPGEPPAPGQARSSPARVSSAARTGGRPPTTRPSQTLFVPTSLWCMTMKGTGTDYKAGLPFLGENVRGAAEPGSNGSANCRRSTPTPASRSGRTTRSCRGTAPCSQPRVASCSAARSISASWRSTRAPARAVDAEMSSGVVGVPSTYMSTASNTSRCMPATAARRRSGPAPLRRRRPAFRPAAGFTSSRSVPRPKRDGIAERRRRVPNGARLRRVVSRRRRGGARARAAGPAAPASSEANSRAPSPALSALRRDCP